MSNQNFDNNSTFSSSPQPVPIAQQLGSQTYLSQVQDKQDAVKCDVVEPVRRTPNRQEPAPAGLPRENKMDAFFRQVEEEKNQQTEETDPSLDPSSNQVIAGHNPPLENQEHQSAHPVQGDAMVELPVVANPMEFTSADSQPPVEPVPRTANLDPQMPPAVSPPADQSHVQPPQTAAPQSFAAQVLAPQANISQSDPNAESTANSSPLPDFYSTTFGGMSGFNPSGAAGQHWAGQNPVVQPSVIDTTFVNDATSITDATSSIPASSDAALHPETANQIDVPVSQPSTNPTNETQRLTGTAGLSAAMAAAGMGTLGVAVAEGKSMQQIRLDQQAQQKALADAASTEQTNPSFEPSAPSNSTAASSNDLPGVTLGNTASPASETVNPQLPMTAEQPSFPPAATPAPISQPSELVQQPAGNVVQNGSASASAQPAYLSPQPTQPIQQPNTAQAQPLEFSADSELDANPVQESNLVSDTDAKLAAMQQAQKIKAERAKMLADQEPVPARPYGINDGINDDANQNGGQPVIDPAAQMTLDQLVLQMAGNGGNPGNPGAVPGLTGNPSPFSQNQGTANQGIVEHVATDAAQRRPFPMALFNHQLLKNLRCGVIFVDHQRRVQMWSKSAELMTGIVAEAVVDRPLYPQTINLRSDDGTGISLEQCPVTQTLETMQIVRSDYRILNAANQEVKIEVTVVPVIDQNRYVNGAIVIFEDHSAEIDLQRQLKDLYEFSVLDPLTQVANRAEFERVLEEYVRAFNASDHFNCAIIICDIDYFKSINDNFGHAVGDQALVAFAEMLKKYVRSQDLVARYGGEEFVILCADCDTDSALQRAEQIRMALFKTQQSMLDGKAISASFGVSELRRGDSAMEFFVRADTALLKAKELGRNRVVIADQREAAREVGVGGDTSVSGVKWRKQRREHTALICEEFKTSTPVSVLVEKLRGFIIEKDAWLQRVDQEFLSMEVDFEDPRDYSRKGSFTMNIEFKEGEDDTNVKSSRKTFIRVTIFPGRRKKWFSTNHTDVAPHLLGDLRSYLMINDEASHLSVKMATENVRG